jgi:hypothetical protein
MVTHQHSVHAAVQVQRILATTGKLLVPITLTSDANMAHKVA